MHIEEPNLYGYFQGQIDDETLCNSDGLVALEFSGVSVNNSLDEMSCFSGLLITHQISRLFLFDFR